MATKRSNGEGSIYMTGDGRWRGAVVGPDGKRRFLSGKNRAEVAKKMKDAQRRADNGLPIGDARRTVADFLEDWLTNVAPTRGRVKSENTLEVYRWAVRNHLVPALGHHKLLALTPEHVEAMLKAKALDGMARPSVVRLRAVLLMALTHGERRGHVYRNAARLAEVPAEARAAGPGRSLNIEQAQALLAGAKGDRLESLYVSGLMLGLRPGELLGLSWDDLDLEGATVQIRQSLKNEPAGLRLGEPKTPRSRRALNLPGPVVESLRAHRLAQLEERLIAGPEWEDHGLVFVTHFGRPIHPSNLRRSFAKLTESAGLGRWHPHELRHSAASLMSAAGVPLEQIADVLGHDGTRMTAQVYRHAVAPTVGAGVAPMESMFG